MRWWVLALTEGGWGNGTFVDAQTAHEAAEWFVTNGDPPRDAVKVLVWRMDDAKEFGIIKQSATVVEL